MSRQEGMRSCLINTFSQPLQMAAHVGPVTDSTARPRLLNSEFGETTLGSPT